MTPSKPPAQRKANSLKLKPLSLQGRSFGFSATSFAPATSSTISSGHTSKTNHKTKVIELSSSSSDDDAKKPRKQSATSVKGKERAILDAHDDAANDALWVDRFEPSNIAELGVHKKKVEDVQRWLSEALEQPRLAKYRRLLVLSGPAGSCKTATIRVLSREMGFEILEYKPGEEGGADALSTQFAAFVSRATAVPTLQFTTDPAQAKTIPPSSQPSSSKSFFPSHDPQRKKIILVEDLPNVFTSDLTKTSFRNALVRFVNATRSYATCVPMVLIISESLVKQSGDNEWISESNHWSDNISARNLVPLQVLKGGKCFEIKFNPVAVTILKKALNAVLDKVYASAGHKVRRPSSQAVELVVQSANGDLRAALNALQFLVREGNSKQLLSVLTTVDVSRGKKRKASGKFKDDVEHEELAAYIRGRETSLFIFHALGKVLYSKRWGENLAEDEKDRRQKPRNNKLPKHLYEFHRQPSKTDPNVLFADAPVDADLFMAYLHQNYTQFMSDIDQCDRALDYFSASDALMRMEGEKFSKNALTSQYSFQTSVRGMMMSLPAPVPRKGQKMFKAELWERNRKARENEQAVGILVTDLSKTFSPVNRFSVTSSEDAADAIVPTVLTTRRILTQDVLPYASLMANTQAFGHLPVYAQTTIKELSTFSVSTQSKQQVLDEKEMVDDQEEEQSHVDTAHMNQPAASTLTSTKAATEQAELLYLVDDDIVDSD